MSDIQKILIVDDEDTLRILVKAELEERGFAVDDAPDGETALQKMESVRYDLIILDIMMPGIDGMEVLRQLREKNLADKVIMLTGVNELKIARDSLELGATDFLTKPYEFKTLLACIERAMRE
ncbi:MAG: response regulator [Ignavibacteriales bacterium]|nr:response regulator [Ignavibacteriales bacterium]